MQTTADFYFRSENRYNIILWDSIIKKSHLSLVIPLMSILFRESDFPLWPFAATSACQINKCSTMLSIFKCDAQQIFNWLIY